MLHFIRLILKIDNFLFLFCRLKKFKGFYIVRPKNGLAQIGRHIQFDRVGWPNAPSSSITEKGPRQEDNSYISIPANRSKSTLALPFPRPSNPHGFLRRRRV